MDKIVLFVIIVGVGVYIVWNWDPSRPYNPDEDRFL